MEKKLEIKYLVDISYPEVEKITLVLNNLNTHKIASLYRAFPPEEARRIARRLEVHLTPLPGSWLNIVEIVLNVMTRQCLHRRIDDFEKLRSELAAWERERNTRTSKIRCHFTSNHAREKMASLYPRIEKSNI